MGGDCVGHLLLHGAGGVECIGGRKLCWAPFAPRSWGAECIGGRKLCLAPFCSTELGGRMHWWEEGVLGSWGVECIGGKKVCWAPFAPRSRGVRPIGGRKLCWAGVGLQRKLMNGMHRLAEYKSTYREKSYLDSSKSKTSCGKSACIVWDVFVCLDKSCMYFRFHYVFHLMSLHM